MQTLRDATRRRETSEWLWPVGKIQAGVQQRGLIPLVEKGLSFFEVRRLHFSNGGGGGGGGAGRGGRGGGGGEGAPFTLCYFLVVGSMCLQTATLLERR